MYTAPFPCSAPLWLLLPAIPFVAPGCVTSPDTLPRDLPDMRSVYEVHMTGSPGGEVTRADKALAAARHEATRPMFAGPAALKGYTRTAWNEIDNLFAPLPNPALVLYIDPHLSEAGYPVPGYSTAFTLYETMEWALPGEVPPPSRPISVTEPGL